VTNSENYTLETWEADMTAAHDAHIDAFALNMAHDDPTNGPSLANAFLAANSVAFEFGLFFSFDYAGNGPWPQSDVIDLLNQYIPETAYYFYNNQPFVSTFEGSANALDWEVIKAETNCFFMPD
jgi:hypothetical protein